MLGTLFLSLVWMAALLLLIVAIVALIQDKKWFSSAPQDIQAAILPHAERFPGAHALGWVLAVLALALFAGALVYGAWDGVRRGWGFGAFYLRFLGMLVALKVFDVLFLDWYLLTKSHFYQHYFPETEGCAGYRQFGFNRKSQLRQLLLSPVAALPMAWVCTLF